MTRARYGSGALRSTSASSMSPRRTRRSTAPACSYSSPRRNDSAEGFWRITALVIGQAISEAIALLLHHLLSYASPCPTAWRQNVSTPYRKRLGGSAAEDHRRWVRLNQFPESSRNTASMP